VDELGKGKPAGAERKVAERSPSPSPSPSKTEDPKVVDARVKALDAYRGYWRTRTLAMEKADWRDRRFHEYSFEDAVAELSGSLFRLQRAGLLTIGNPKSTPKVLWVDLNKPTAKPHFAKIRDCLDMSAVKTVNSQSKKEVGRQLPPRPYPAEALLRTVGEKWKVVDLKFHEGQSC
jgi:hypothetical protein